MNTMKILLPALCVALVVCLVPASSVTAQSVDTFVPFSEIRSAIESVGVDIYESPYGTSAEHIVVYDRALGEYFISTSGDNLFLAYTFKTRKDCEELKRFINDKSKVWLLSGSGKVIVGVAKTNSNEFILKLNEALKGL